MTSIRYLTRRRLVIVEEQYLTTKEGKDSVISSKLINLDFANGTVDLDKVAPQIRNDIEECMGENPSSSTNKMTPISAFDKFLTWNGIMGYSQLIAKALVSIIENTR